MVAKALLVCASALFIKTISSQCFGGLNAVLSGPGFNPDFPINGPGFSFGPGMSPINGYASLTGINPSSLSASFGGGLQVTSSSPIPPTGLIVTSENAIEGALAVAGNLPFLGTVAVEGAYQTAGAGAVSYGCGNGAVGITAENVPSGISPAGIAPGFAQSGIAPGFAQAGIAPSGSALGFNPNGIAPGFVPGYGWGAGGALY